jgi:hypothetical protein
MKSTGEEREVVVTVVIAAGGEGREGCRCGNF